jgi:hypothetical protein
VDNESIPWYFEQKHPDSSSPFRLSSGQEILLILAEDALVNGQDAAGAVGFINRVRALAGVDPIEAASVDEAWTMLKRERYIELWLEARRLGDRRRWDGPDGVVTTTPGEYQFYELNNWRDEPYTFHHSYPIPLSEIDTNPNVTSARPF